MINIGIIASYFVLWVLVLCLSATVYVLARHVGMLHIRTGNAGARATNDGPDIGARLAEVTANTLDGRPFTIGGAKGRHTLLLFISPRCFNCSELAPAFKSIARNEKDVELILIGRGRRS
jgi:methylamine dehydrogenase accessory protein MauD